MIGVCLLLAVAGSGFDLPPALVEPPKARASIGPPQTELGRSVSLFISVTYPAQVSSVRLGKLDLGEVFETRRRSKKQEVVAGQKETTFEIELVPWYVGKLRVPKQKIVYVVDGRAYVVFTNDTQIDVQGIAGESKTRRDDPAPVRLYLQKLRLIWLGLAVLVLLIVLGLIALLVRRRRLRERYASWNPESRELLRLRLAEANKLAANGREVDALHLAASGLRSHLARVEDSWREDLTTTELDALLRARNQEAVADWLNDADKIKFARNYQGGVSGLLSQLNTIFGVGEDSV